MSSMFKKPKKPKPQKVARKDLSQEMLLAKQTQAASIGIAHTFLSRQPAGSSGVRSAPAQRTIIG